MPGSEDRWPLDALSLTFRDHIGSLLCVRVSVRAPECPHEPGRHRCPWGGDQLLGGNRRSKGTAIRKQLEPLIGRYSTESFVDIDVYLKLELTSEQFPLLIMFLLDFCQANNCPPHYFCQPTKIT